MGDCSSDVNYARIIALHIITTCARLFVAYCVFLHCSDNGIVTIIAMHVVNMRGRVLTDYCVGDCHMNVPAIIPRVHTGTRSDETKYGCFSSRPLW